jgi:hypothetical protein
VRRIAASAIVTEVLDLEAFRYWFDPKFVGNSMHDMSAT